MVITNKRIDGEAVCISNHLACHAISLCHFAISHSREKMATSSRNVLSLKEKLKVLKYIDQHPKESTRQLEEKFSCGKTQILRNKKSLVRSYEDNALLSRKRTSNKDANEAIFRWFKLVKQQNIPISGPLPQQEAKLASEKKQH